MKKRDSALRKTNEFDNEAEEAKRRFMALKEALKDRD
jgi:hypothetical protein